MRPISPQVLSDTIGAIYDCALEPDHWPDAFRRITEMTRSAAMGMGLIDHKWHHNMHLYEYGFPEEYTRLYFEKFAKMNPVFVGRLLFPVGEPLTAEMIIDESEFLESRLYKELVEPAGYRFGVTIELLRLDHRSAGTMLMRTEAQHRYDADDLALLRLLAPHLCRAAAISDALELKTLKSNLLQTTLDSLSTGVLLGTRDGRIVYMNAMAEKQAKVGGTLHIMNNRLVFSDAAANAALVTAISSVSANATKDDAGARSLPVPDKTGGPGYVATILPIETGRRQELLGPFAASFAIFVQDPSQPRMLPGAAFAKLHGLTGGELRVLLALTQGLGVREVADLLGISEPTVRTHLQRLFSKTGTSRQVELVTLLQSSGPPLRSN